MAYSKYGVHLAELVFLLLKELVLLRSLFITLGFSTLRGMVSEERLTSSRF